MRRGREKSAAVVKRLGWGAEVQRWYFEVYGREGNLLEPTL